MTTEKKAENKGDIRMITLTEKDADSVIRLLKEMQEYRKKDFEQATEKLELIQSSSAESAGKGIFSDFFKVFYGKEKEACKRAFAQEDERFQRAMLLLTAGSEAEKEKEE